MQKGRPADAFSKIAVQLATSIKSSFPFNLTHANLLQVGQGSVSWSPNLKGTWAEVTLEPGWASQQACVGRMEVAVALDPDSPGSLAIKRSANRAAPLLLVTPGCGGGSGGSCGGARARAGGAVASAG